MGINHLIPALEGAMPKTDLKEMAGQTAAVDVSCWLHIGLSVSIDPGQYAYRKLMDLKELGIKPLVVLDGPHPDAKSQTVDKRKRKREEYQKNAQKCKEEGDHVKADRLLRKASGRTVEYEKGLKRFCRTNNIAYVQAPYEADAQIAFMMQNKMVDFVITKDSDLIIYNCKKIMFNIFDGVGDLFDQDHFEECWGHPFQVDCLLAVCICAGCDYFPGGIRNFGIKSAKELYPHLLPEFDFNKLLNQLGKYYPSLQVPEDFSISFHRAFSTFKHQLVINPELGTIVPLTPYKDGLSHVDFPFAGIPTDVEVDFWNPPLDSNITAPKRRRRVQGRKFYCRDCQVAFISSKLLKAHRAAIHPYICSKCPKKFECQAYLTDHMDSHGSEPKHKCDQCENVFWTKWSLGKHKTKQHSGRIYKCPKCGLVLSRSDGLLEHLRLVCSKQKKAFPCTLCGRSYDTWLRWDAHMRRIHKISRRSQKKLLEKAEMKWHPLDFAT